MASRADCGCTQMFAAVSVWNYMIFVQENTMKFAFRVFYIVLRLLLKDKENNNNWITSLDNYVNTIARFTEKRSGKLIHKQSYNISSDC